MCKFENVKYENMKMKATIAVAFLFKLIEITKLYSV